MKMKIAGHRGAPSFGLENSLESLKKAVDLGVDAVEFDVRKTLDNKIVLSHDGNLERTGGGDHEIAELTYKELQKFPLSDGKPVPLLSEALQVLGNTQAIIEIKSKDTVALVLEIVDQHTATPVSFASPIYSEIEELKRLRPKAHAYIRVVVNPFEAFYIAKAIKADGLDLNFWLINPLTYFMARRANMDIMLYPIGVYILGWQDRPLFVRFLRLLYPGVAICTNHPERFIKQKRKRLISRKPA